MFMVNLCRLMNYAEIGDLSVEDKERCKTKSVLVGPEVYGVLRAPKARQNF